MILIIHGFAEGESLPRPLAQWRVDEGAVKTDAWRMAGAGSPLLPRVTITAIELVGEAGTQRRAVAAEELLNVLSTPSKVPEKAKGGMATP
jgi:hypothetical protein